MRKKDYYEAYLDDFDKIIVYISKDSYGGESNSFHLLCEDSKLIPLRIHTIETSNNYIKYTLGLDVELEIGKEYYVMHQHARKTILQYSGIVKTQRFDEMFYYDGDDLGCTYTPYKTSFALWAPSANRVKIEVCKNHQAYTYEMKRSDKGVFRLSLVGDWEHTTYIYYVKVHGEWKECIDPYANATIENSKLAAVVDLSKLSYEATNLTKMNSNCDAIIYEASVRDFTSQSEIGIEHPSTFVGFMEENLKTSANSFGFSYLKSLGITHLQLMPVFDFGSVEELNPRIYYNWGYDPVHYRVLEGSYSTNPKDPYARMQEFLNLVEKCHVHGIRVNLDVVFNHVYDMNDCYFENSVPNYYFQMNNEGDFSNGTFCGNDIDSSRMMCRKYIVDTCKFIAKTYHVDGLRFDLMGILDVDTLNEVVAQCREINPDFMVYGEGWDMPSFLDYRKRASMFNSNKMPQVAHFSDRFRDVVKGRTNQNEVAIKGYCSGALHLRDLMKNCLAASCSEVGLDKLFENPYNVVNYVECHDNMTCWDKIKECCKEEGQDVKLEMHKMMIAAVLLAQGIPFIHSGQEFARTKLGRHNTYEDSDDINKLDYLRRNRYLDIVNDTKALINIRRNYSCLRLASAQEIANQVHFKDEHNYALNYICEDDKCTLSIIFNPSYERFMLDLKDSYEMLYYQSQPCQQGAMQYLDVKPFSVIVMKKDKGE